MQSGSDWMLEFGDVEAVLERSLSAAVLRAGRLATAPLLWHALGFALQPALGSDPGFILFSLLSKHTLFWTLEKGGEKQAGVVLLLCTWAHSGFVKLHFLVLTFSL